jgi:small ligand-binding sensory domain FIST
VVSKTEKAMKWSSLIGGTEEGEKSSAKQTAKQVIDKMAEQLVKELGQTPDLVIAFVSHHFARSYEKIPGYIKDTLKPKAFVGCSAGGLIGGGEEVEHDRGIALAGAVMPAVTLSGFHIFNEQIPDADAPPSEWEKIVGVESGLNPSFILLPDPFSFRIDSFVQGIDYAFANSVKVGGLASGTNEPGRNALFLNDDVYTEGMVGLSISGNVVVDAVVAQGCRPIGKPLRVTACQGNILLELDGESAIGVLKEVLEDLSPQDQELARNSLFLGVVMDEFKTDFKCGDFLIRNLVGLVPEAGAIVVGELLRQGKTVQFHLRDAATSSEDLRLMLKNYRDRIKLAGGAAQTEGALLFSCLGRGKHLYGVRNHDSDSFRESVGEVPLAGFFCNGEIGPVSGTTFLHGYTSSFGLFRAKDSSSSL